MGEARHLRFLVLIDTDSARQITPTGVCSGSRDVFKFWEMS